MKPVDQTKFGTEGNCFAACIASLLELPIEAVAVDGGAQDWWKQTQEWCVPRGLCYVEFDRQPNGFLTYKLPGPLCIFTGKSPRGLNHAVVGKCDREYQIIFDPHPSRAGIESIDAVGFFVPLDPVKLGNLRAESEADPKPSLDVKVPKYEPLAQGYELGR